MLGIQILPLKMVGCCGCCCCDDNAEYKDTATRDGQTADVVAVMIMLNIQILLLKMVICCRCCCCDDNAEYTSPVYTTNVLGTPLTLGNHAKDLRLCF